MWSRSFRSTPLTSRYLRRQRDPLRILARHHPVQIQPATFAGDVRVVGLVAASEPCRMGEPGFTAGSSATSAPEAGHRFRFQHAAGIAGKGDARIDIERPRNHHRAEQEERPEREQQSGTGSLDDGGRFIVRVASAAAG